MDIHKFYNNFTFISTLLKENKKVKTMPTTIL